jgi:hypothetical protein
VGEGMWGVMHHLCTESRLIVGMASSSSCEAAP